MKHIDDWPKELSKLVEEGHSYLVYSGFVGQLRKQLIEEIIALSDDIELQYHTTLEEWKAFKHFRNTLRDRYGTELGVNKKND